MANRNAKTELNHDNCKEKEEPQEAGVFVQADNKTMEGRVIKKAKRRGVKMTASMSKFEIQTCFDKKLTNFDEKKCRDVDKFPVNFSGVPHIGEKIFGFLDFKDLNNCNEVCKGWQNFLQERRTLWIELLEKEKTKLESSVNCSDRSGDLLFSDLWDIHNDEHDEDYCIFGWSGWMSEEELEFYSG